MEIDMCNILGKADTTLNEQGRKKVVWPRSVPLNVQPITSNRGHEFHGFQF